MISTQPALLVLLAAISLSQITHSAHGHSVAVIGGGVAGASAAYHITKLTNFAAKVDVFEADTVGGRAAEVVYKGEVLELGASIIWENNYLVKNVAKDLGLEVKWLGKSSSKDSSHKVQSTLDNDVKEGQGDGGLSIWDGDKFVMTQGGSVWELPKLVWRYGAAPYIYGKHAYKVWEDYFKPIYDLQDKGVAFHTPNELLNQTGLWSFTQENCKEHMKSVLTRWYIWGASRFIEEFAGGINRVNYNQLSSSMNALAGLVSYLPAAGGRLWAVQGGNSRLAGSMIQASQATVKLGLRVTAVTQGTDGQYTLSVYSGEGEGDKRVLVEYGPYEAVVIATPLELSGIEVKLQPGAGTDRVWTSKGEGAVLTVDVNIEVDAAAAAGTAVGVDVGATVDNDETGSVLGPESEELKVGDGEEGRKGLEVEERHQRVYKEAIVNTQVVGDVNAQDIDHVVEEAYPDVMALDEMDVTDMEGQDVNTGMRRARWFGREYQSTVTTFVTGGELQASAFGVDSLTSHNVLVTEHADTDFSSISVREVQGEKVYKVFSESPLPGARIQELFGSNAQVLTVKPWLAYPTFAPPEQFTPFELSTGLCYSSALENSASALEVAALAGRNCAILLAQTLSRSGNGNAQQ